jgi:hypothetical protein
MNIKSALLNTIIDKITRNGDLVFKPSIVDVDTVQKGKCSKAMLDELSNGRGDD